MIDITLTKMQKFALDFVNSEKRQINAGYLATMWIESKGRAAPAASRDRFGSTSAAYKTLRNLSDK